MFTENRVAIGERDDFRMPPSHTNSVYMTRFKVSIVMFFVTPLPKNLYKSML